MDSKAAHNDPHILVVTFLGNPLSLGRGGTCDLLDNVKDDISMNRSLKILTSLLLASLTFAGFGETSWHIRSCPIKRLR